MVYQYTLPRGPVMASFRGPGPCYGLPGLTGQVGHDARSTHNRAPGYYMGLRLRSSQKSASPGPVYLPQHKIYRDGKDGTPHISLGDRRPMTAGLAVPGPGAYSPERTRGSSAHLQAPSYSFRKRTALARRDKTPGKIIALIIYNTLDALNSITSSHHNQHWCMLS